MQLESVYTASIIGQPPVWLQRVGHRATWWPPCASRRPSRKLLSTPLVSMMPLAFSGSVGGAPDRARHQCNRAVLCLAWNALGPRLPSAGWLNTAGGLPLVCCLWWLARFCSEPFEDFLRNYSQDLYIHRVFILRAARGRRSTKAWIL